MDDPEFKACPKNAAQYLAALCYAKRTKVDPFFIEGVMAGVKNGEKSLTYVDLYGNKFEDNYIATGFARIIAPTIIDSHYNPNISVENAKKLIVDSFTALNCRYKISSRTISVAYVTEEGISDEKIDIYPRFDYEGYKNKEDFI